MSKENGQGNGRTARIDYQRERLVEIVRAVNELGEGVNQQALVRHLGFKADFVSIQVRQAIQEELLENTGGGLNKQYSLGVTEKGLRLIGEHKPTPITPPGTTSTEEIVLRLSRTVERLLEENDRLKQENERISRREYQEKLSSEEFLKENLRLEEEVKGLKDHIESYKEQVKQLQQFKAPAKTDLVPRVAHAMAVFGD